MLDIYKYLSQWLEDTDRFHLMITSKEMIKLDLTFDQQHNYNDIYLSSFYHNFTNIFANELMHHMSRILGYPNKLKRLLYYEDKNPNNCFSKPKNVSFPSTITHLDFFRDYGRKVDIIIPTSVTHLTFGKYFNRIIEGIIPSSVTHLTFRKYFDQSVKNIPSSVTHLTVGLSFTKFREIPKHVTNIFICRNYHIENIRNILPGREVQFNNQ